MDPEIYKPKNIIRIVTAASLFDGHDVAINIMRRILQASGAEIIHLGHNRSVEEIVSCAIQEDVQAIAITSYQGGHIEFFKYMFDLLREKGADHIRIFGGGGGTILPEEIIKLQEYGITRIYSPDDGRELGLQGMINELLQLCDIAVGPCPDMPAAAEVPGNAVQVVAAQDVDPGKLARLITCIESHPEKADELLAGFKRTMESPPNRTAKSPPGQTAEGTAGPPSGHKPGMDQNVIPVIGITGTGGAGKSSLTDELVRRYLADFPDGKLAIISVDPSKRKTGGALLGDRIRMNAINHPSVYMRSLATRQAHSSLPQHTAAILDACRQAGFDLILLESSGIGQSDTQITEYCDVSLYVMTPEFGAATQLEKIDMLDFADLVAINKFDKRGAEDALRDVKKQYIRNRNLWSQSPETLPVYGTIASQFNDPGTNALYSALMNITEQKTGVSFPTRPGAVATGAAKTSVIPPARSRYLAEIVENNQEYDQRVEEQSEIARRLYQLNGVMELLQKDETAAISFDETVSAPAGELSALYQQLQKKLHPDCRKLIESWPQIREKYEADELVYKVRGRDIHQPLNSLSLSKLKIPKITLPQYSDWGDLLHWQLTENVPGEFPYTAGVFPLKRQNEDPTRMFAGEGGPERTNKRFHYLALGQPAQRLSTAFDSVTLYGEDPHPRPDIYGKIGNSGVSVATLDDCKKLYSGFDLCKPSTSVSMTINGPAPMLLGFFLNTAIDQQCEKYILENGLKEEVTEKIRRIYEDDKGLPVPVYNASLPADHDRLGLLLLGVTGDQVLPAETYEKIKQEALSTVRGTVQADILKEDQAQNTCIFSTEFALRMMGDIQEYFSRNKVKNFYSVSISGYHIAEAGANPVTQLAFTLANGFTFVEYYLSRGMHIDDFAPNLSFFFSNGIDPEYSVIGRVARRIWAKAMKYKYKGNERSQKLKYHIQTSGRSLHAQEIDFNDIRTTLQALYAVYDNCNSLHTNAYDEAITTPTEESVRRAMAIQLIINRELGLAKNENPLQGAFIIEKLSQLVEEAVYDEFARLSERGGVLGAMETMYQRGKIQEESHYYEELKHQGNYPIIGVNTFLSKEGSPTLLPREVIRALEPEKQFQIQAVEAFKQRNQEEATRKLEMLRAAALENSNTFDRLMEASKVCSLGQISEALYHVGGQYRRNM